MRVLWIGKTGDANAWYHIAPWAESEAVEALTVVRATPPQRRIDANKVRWVHFGAASRPVEAARYVRAGVRELRSGRHDVVVSFGFVPWGFLASCMALPFRVPVVAGLIGSDFNRHIRRGGPVAEAVGRVLARASVITVPGGAMRRAVEEWLRVRDLHGCQVKVFPHCLPDEFLEEAPVRSPEGCRLITVGALLESKRTIDAIRALPILVERGCDPQLTVLGTGPREEALRSEARRLGVERRVRFAGYVRDVRRYLDEADIFVQTSLSEGLSLSLVEAMGRGLVPVTTVAGSEEDLIVDGVNGLFVRPGDPKHLALRVQEAMRRRRELEAGVRATREKLRIRRAADAVGEILRVAGSTGGRMSTPGADGSDA